MSERDWWTPRLLFEHFRLLGRIRWLKKHPGLSPEQRLLVSLYGPRRVFKGKRI